MDPGTQVTRIPVTDQDSMYTNEQNIAKWITPCPDDVQRK